MTLWQDKLEYDSLDNKWGTLKHDDLSSTLTEQRKRRRCSSLIQCPGPGAGHILVGQFKVLLVT